DREREDKHPASHWSPFGILPIARCPRLPTVLDPALTHVCRVMQSGDMPNDAAVTVRIPAALKRRLEERARRGHRTLSAQLLHDLEQLTAAPPQPARKRFLGLFAGTPVPSDAEILDMRNQLWGRLTARHRG